MTCRMVLQSGHGSVESYTLSVCGETHISRRVGPQQSIPLPLPVLCIKSAADDQASRTFCALQCSWKRLNVLTARHILRGVCTCQCRAAQPSSATVPSRKPKKGHSNPEQVEAGSQAGRGTSTIGVAEPEAKQDAAACDGPSDVGKSSQGPSAESRQPAEGQELQRHSDADGEPATEAEADGQLEEQEGQLPSGYLQVRRLLLQNSERWSLSAAKLYSRVVLITWSLRKES